ncbi:MAG TPA: cupin domain-containing protein [Ignavibacteria bacterium]|nr:cupin domain-containing protein [Ignavibacteria bacterium]
MAYKLIKDTKTGDTFERTVSSEDTGGKYSTVKLTLKPGGFKPVIHYHAVQDESFEVISGKLTYILNSRQGAISSGEKITLPMGVPHTHYNNENEDLVINQTVSPSLDFDLFSDTIFGLASEGKLRKGTPGLLQVMMMIKKLESKTYLAAIPRSVQNALAVILFPAGKLFGKKAVYKRFSGFDI